MNKPFFEINSGEFSISAFEIKPPEGYELPSETITGEAFPMCCPFHKSVFNSGNKWFEKYPDCHDRCRKLYDHYQFKKEDFAGLPMKIVQQLSYTEHLITDAIVKDDWLDDISDYITFNVWSFGTPAIGLDHYLSNLKHYVKITQSDIPQGKRKKIIEFIDSHYHSKDPKPKADPTDLNELYEIYQRWLQIFPFNLSYFAHLKSHFEDQLPIAKGKPVTNRYMGISRVEMHTKESLIEVLLLLTNELITQLNSLTIYENGQLSEPKKVQLELLIQGRKTKCNTGYIDKKGDWTQQFSNVLENWLNDEVQFLNQLIPIIDGLAEPASIVFDENSTTVIKALNEYGFSDFLTKANINPDKVYNLFAKHSGREFFPYVIALLHKLKYLEYFFKHHTTTKSRGFVLLAKVFGVNERRVKGNINVLNPSSSEDPSQYTSSNYLEIVRDEIKGL